MSAVPHLDRLADAPRPAGGPAAADARDYCAGVLRSLGFDVIEQEFEYSKFPGAFSAPLLGLASAAYLAAAARVGIRAETSGLPHGAALLRAPGPLILLGVLACAIVGIAAGQHSVLSLPLLRARATNLQATRGGAAPSVWLIAHIDSKWQPVPMLARVAGVVLVVAATLATLVMVFLSIFSHDAPPLLFRAVVVAGWIGALPLVGSVVGRRSHGALDNASGVAAVLEAAALVPGDRAVGVVITDAEELALAGVRAWLDRRARDTGAQPAVALNCDSIDDGGLLTVMYSRPQPARMVAGLRAAANAEGVSVRVMGMLPGVLTDSIPLAAAGWGAVTLSRGTIRTLNRIHTSWDSLDHMTGSGIAAAARVLARAAADLS